jgi:hypothetical protein
MSQMDVGDVVHVSELQLPEKVELTQSLDPDTPVVSIYTPQAESTADDEGEGGELDTDSEGGAV